ncbi:nucleoside phosphorylase [Paenibacillus humicus]|uniref:nucleoside phosphorylase n=1 Tax=Paenibacillus humicus TaxID=412861 RepID=UPI003F179E0D
MDLQFMPTLNETQSTLPILDHLHGASSVFRPEDVVDAVRKQRRLPISKLPSVCVLDFDGDLTDALVQSGKARIVSEWACFHTNMWSLEIDGQQCGIIPRTIGGPYSVMVAEQLLVSGVKAVIGLTSAGRIGSTLPVPGLVIADRAIRDEGTSLHYLPPGNVVDAPEKITDALEKYCSILDLPVSRGLVWTTDAPYRETAEQTEHYAAMGALAVEMQAASLFAFAEARGAVVGVVAHITNDVTYDLYHDKESFDKGPHKLQLALLEAIYRGALSVTE